MARTVVYSLMTLSVVVIVSVLMLVVLGYYYNQRDGKIEQGGLLRFASVPSGATVTLDGIRKGSRTPTGESVEAKQHFVQMDLKGYRTWQKSIVVRAGGIGWLNYTRFIPTTVKTESLRTFPKLAGSLATDDRKWIALLEDAAVPTVTLANVESETVKYSQVEVPSDILTPAQTPVPQSFTLESWSGDSTYILLKRVYDTDKTEWIVLDRGAPEKSVNVTTTFAIDASKVVFGEYNGRTLFVQASDLVRKVNLGDRTMSGPLASGIEDFSVFDNTTVLYVTKPDANNERHAGYRTSDMDKAQTVFSYPGATANIHLSFGDYAGKRYVAVTHDDTLDVYSGVLPRGTTKANLKRVTTVTLTATPIDMAISNTGRFVITQLPDGFTTYDIELQKADTASFKQPATVVRKLHYLDDYMLWNDRGNTLRFYEFDGANQQDIMPVAEGQAVTLSGDNKYAYGFANVNGGIALQRATLILE